MIFTCKKSMSFFFFWWGGGMKRVCQTYFLCECEEYSAPKISMKYQKAKLAKCWEMERARLYFAYHHNKCPYGQLRASLAFFLLIMPKHMANRRDLRIPLKFELIIMKGKWKKRRKWLSDIYLLLKVENIK